MINYDIIDSINFGIKKILQKSRKTLKLNVIGC